MESRNIAVIYTEEKDNVRNEGDSRSWNYRGFGNHSVLAHWEGVELHQVCFSQRNLFPYQSTSPALFPLAETFGQNGL